VLGGRILRAARQYQAACQNGGDDGDERSESDPAIAHD
jgi:hypothetical protein